MRVGVTAFYSRLKRMPSEVIRNLVRLNAERLTPVIESLGGANPEPIPGYVVRVLDGNHLNKTQRRLKVLRDVAAGPLPGQTLVVLSPAMGLALDVIACEDGHASERSLIAPILESVKENEAWIADSNFCTNHFLFGIHERQAAFIIRRHAGFSCWERETAWESAGRINTGTLMEQTLWLCGHDGSTMEARRIRLTLNAPTSDGETEIEILTNLPREVATAAVVAEQYRERWTVKGLFRNLKTVLRCEVNTLGYPPAALFAFGVALLASNIYATVKAALRAEHGSKAVDKLSDYHTALEVSGTRLGLEIAVSEAVWTEIGDWSFFELAAWLRSVLGGVKLSRYRKASRGPKKPPRPRTRFANSRHVSTARLLKGEQI